MAKRPGLVPLLDSHLPAIDARAFDRRVDDDRLAEVSVYLRRESVAQLNDSPRRAYGTTHVDHDRLLERHGVEAERIARVQEFADRHDMRVAGVDRVAHSVRLVGRTESLNRAFGVELADAEHAGDRFHTHEGPVHVPSELEADVEMVLGLDTRPVARRHAETPHDSKVDPKHLPAGQFKPPQLGEIYDFPTGVDGSGETIAIVELGGGYDRAELQTYFDELGIALPTIVTADGAPQGGTATGGDEDMEVAMDVQVAGSLAPGAKFVFYFGENTLPGFINTLTMAMLDPKHKPSIVTVSWGAPEVGWPKKAAEILAQNVHTAANAGVTTYISAGDLGATEGLCSGTLTPAIPASIPWCVSCGGTRLTANGAGYGGEVVWGRLAANGGATGGGISSHFALPDYQQGAGVPVVPPVSTKGTIMPRVADHCELHPPKATPPDPVGGFAGRGVPDVSAVADAQTGYLMYVHGTWMVKGGTSAVAPLWAALTARMNQQVGTRAGYLNDSLYALRSTPAFHQVLDGENGYWKGGAGWNPCTGLGTPVGTKLLAALREHHWTDG